MTSLYIKRYNKYVISRLQKEERENVAGKHGFHRGKAVNHTTIYNQIVVRYRSGIIQLQAYYAYSDRLFSYGSLLKKILDNK